MQSSFLNQYGWKNYSKDLNLDDIPDSPGRIILQHRNKYKLITKDGEIWVRAAGNLFYSIEDDSGLPAVGDWVTYEFNPDKDLGLIKTILPRRNKIVRKAAGQTSNLQVIASNIDTVFIVSALDQEFNLRRLERYLIIAKQSHIKPVFVLNKIDIAEDSEQKIKALESIAAKNPILVISALKKIGLNQFDTFLKKGKTVAFIGSSGVGKSTIINGLLGEERLKVNTVDSRNKGRHTTSHKELFMLPSGCLVIDTPGMRELQMINVQDGIEQTFTDILDLAQDCYFRDCQHLNEPKCAVKAAIESGKMEEKRLVNYQKVINEIENLQRFKKEVKKYTVKEKKRFNKKKNLH